MVNPDQLFVDKLIKELGEMKFNYLNVVAKLEAANVHIQEFEQAPVQDPE